MGKNCRGKNIKKIPNWRGTCPICKRPRVKLLWDKLSENKTIKVCKVCASKKV